MARPGTVVDIAVEMPRTCFDEKDHLNHRYFARRAQYLGEVAAKLRTLAAFKSVTWTFLCHDIRCWPKNSGHIQVPCDPLSILVVILQG